MSKRGVGEVGTFAASVVLSDKFLALPISTRCLYFTFGVSARDKGIVIGARHLAEATGCSTDDIDILVSKGYLVPAEDGHYRIVHWYENAATGQAIKKRNSYDYRQWRKTVIDRDKTCKICGSNRRLEAHHIKPFSMYPELRYDPDNGITLCCSCHRKLHGLEKKHGKEKNVQFGRS